ncbi:MAG TPA: ABC transporter substrate-binding protein [Polyangiales bacterium]
MARWSNLLARCCAVLIVVGALPRAQAEDKPSVIRLANPGVGIGNRPVVGGSSATTLHLKGMLEEEFRKDGIRIEWAFLRGAGPAVNELYANGLVDFSLLGDLPSIIGKAGGLKTRVLAATAIRGSTYVAVPSDSSINSIKDLKGKKVAMFKGTNIQLAINKILEKNGLKEKDVRFINMDTATAKAALVTKDIDAAFGGADFIALRDQGIAKIVYNSRDDDPRFLRHCTFVGSEAFIQKYPQITQRVVTTLVKAAKWLSDYDKNPTPVYQLWTKSGVQFSNYKEDLAAESLKVRSSPLLDPYIVSTYKWNISEAKRFGLIRNDINWDQWVDRRFLDKALKELGLENYWQAVGPQGWRPGQTADNAPAPSAVPAAPKG